MRTRITVLLLGILLSGCVGVSKYVVKPTELQSKGLVMARFSGVGATYAALSNAFINDKKYTQVINDNYLLLALPPGKYKLEAMSNSFYSYSANVPFEIKAGQVTSLGHLFAEKVKSKIDPTLSGGQDRFRVIRIRNDKELLKHLRYKYPDIYAKLKTKKIKNVSKNLLASKKVKRIRKVLAKRNLLKRIKSNRNNSSRIINAELGTFAIIDKNKNGKFKNLRHLNLGTFSPLYGCSESKTRYACMLDTNSGRKLVYGSFRDKKPKISKIPSKTEKQILLVFGRKSVVILDEFYNLYVSRNGGKTFRENSKYKLKNAISGSFGIVYSDFAKFYFGNKGFYIIDKEDEARILFHKYKDKGKFVALPKLDEEIRGRIYETAKGVVLFDVGYANDTEVFHMLNGSKKWTKSIIPKNLCRKIKLTDYKKGKFHVECAPGHLSGKAEDYESYDSGATWKKLK